MDRFEKRKEVHPRIYRYKTNTIWTVGQEEKFRFKRKRTALSAFARGEMASRLSHS